MAPTQVRLHHRRRRLGRERAGQSPVGRPGDARPGPRGRAARLPVRRLHPHAGGADLPDRQPLLRLEVRVGARAVHERPAHLPRPRQGPRRLVEHQRPDLPARQPARLRALGGRPGHGDAGTTPTACRTSRRWRPASRPPPDDPWRGHDGPLVLERGPATNPLFTAFFAACQEAGYHLTDDVNGYRQEGFAPFDRNIHRGRRLSGRAGLPAAGPRPAEPDRPDADVRDRRSCSTGGRAVAVDIERRGGGTERIEGGEIILAGGAINTPQLLQLSGRRPRPTTCEALGIPVVADLPGRRRPPPGPPRGLHPVHEPPAGLDAAVGDAALAPAVHRRAVAVPAQRARARPTTSRAAGSPAANDDVAYPNLMFHFLPLAIRYDGSAGAAGHGYQVHVGPMYSDARGSVTLKTHRPARPPGAALQLPLDRAGPARVGRGRPRRPAHPQPAGDGRRTTAARRRRGRS